MCVAVWARSLTAADCGVIQSDSHTEVDSTAPRACVRGAPT